MLDHGSPEVIIDGEVLERDPPRTPRADLARQRIDTITTHFMLASINDSATFGQAVGIAT